MPLRRFRRRGAWCKGSEDAVITVWAPQRREGFVIALLDAVIGFKGKYPQAIVDVQIRMEEIRLTS